MSNNRLFKLKHLVEELTDRDQKVKNDLSLFESVFENFPIPVVFWSVNLAGKLFSKKISCGGCWHVLNKDATSLSDFYKCDSLQKDMDRYWEKVSLGEPCSFLSISAGHSDGDIYLWNRLIPTMVDQKVVSVTGLSWDVTSNHDMLESLEQIKIATEENPDLRKIYDNASLGIERSRLNKLINKEE